MNWSVVGSLGEAVGAIGVIGSLVYLALQVRAGSKGLFTTMRESVFNSLKEWNYNIMSDPDLAWIFQQGCKDYNSLNEEVWVYNRLVFMAYAAHPGAKHIGVNVNRLLIQDSIR